MRNWAGLVLLMIHFLMLCFYLVGAIVFTMHGGYEYDKAELVKGMYQIFIFGICISFACLLLTFKAGGEE